MKLPILSLLLWLISSTIAIATTPSPVQDDNSFTESDTIQQNGITLIYINKQEGLSVDLSAKLQETFFAVYPKLCKAYNRKSARKVTFVIDPAYDGVAATSDARVVFNPRWFDQHPNDIDVVTHEVMHIVQDYGETNGPWWITEGIADYARFKFGVDNEGAGWKLPDVTETQNYDNSYRVTARFFTWIVQNKNKKFVEKMDKIMREHRYSDAVWVKLTGNSPAELWKEYIANPQI
ncbi:basic secretory protein-like protein [Mangrovibacterium diazotrophicum]|nr:basic secretory protein-like protein [Mangrovibacterium diazotrophicum]